MSYTSGFVVLSILSYVVYMTTFHPLARYPGPFLAKLTDLFCVWHAVHGTRHSELHELHQKHGDFVRWGPNTVSVNHAAALGQIYGAQANVRKSTWYSAFNSLSIFSAVEKEVHARKRRVMTHAFSDQAVRDMQPYILAVVREWCEALGDRLDPTTTPAADQWSTPKDMRAWSAYVIFDSLGQLLFGESFHTTHRTENRFFLELMAANARFINIIGQMPILGRALSVISLFTREQTARRAKQFGFLIAKLKKRLALDPTGVGRRDIIHFLQRAKDPNTGQGYSEAELTGETALLLGAGSDTANTTLTSLFYFLTHNPTVLTQLTEFIRHAFPAVQHITGQTLASQPYLRACVDEALRLCPPVPMGLPREVCEGGIRVLDHHFPSGTVISVPTYALHHSETYFEQPFRYDPSRWLSEAETGTASEGRSAEVLARQRQAFVPFSVGPRACIGRGVALLELYLCIARVVFLYDVRIAPGTEGGGVGRRGEYKMKDFFIVGKEGPILQFRPARAEEKQA